MTERRWRAGDEFSLDGVHYRVVAGYKHPDDLRIEQWTEGRWQPIRMAVGAMLADFFSENEDVLYPPPKKGWRYYFDYMHNARKHGWEKAEAVLRLEKRQSRSQASLFDKEAS